MAKRGKERGERIEPAVECEVLEPIRVVQRELTRPDGTTLKVDVPVYPPFRLQERKAPATPAGDRARARRAGPDARKKAG